MKENLLITIFVARYVYLVRVINSFNNMRDEQN